MKNPETSFSTLLLLQKERNHTYTQREQIFTKQKFPRAARVASAGWTPAPPPPWSPRTSAACLRVSRSPAPCPTRGSLAYLVARRLQGGVPANLAGADGHPACEANCTHRRGSSPLPTRGSAARRGNPKGAPASLGLPARGAESRPGGGAESRGAGPAARDPGRWSLREAGPAQEGRGAFGRRRRVTRFQIFNRRGSHVGASAPSCRGRLGAGTGPSRRRRGLGPETLQLCVRGRHRRHPVRAQHVGAWWLP